MQRLCNFEQLKINQKYISLFASGLSINEMREEEFAYLKKNTYMIGTNYFIHYYTPHLLVFSDVKTMRFYREYFGSHPKNFPILVREEAFDEDPKDPFKNKVDYWYNSAFYNLHGNYTAVWVIQLLRKFFPDKQLLLFGFDFYIPDNVGTYTVKKLINKVEKTFQEPKAKCYDYKTDYNIKDRDPGKYKGSLEKFEKILHQCKEKSESFVHNVWNCNLWSKTDIFRKKPYKEILEGTHMRILHLCNSALAGAPLHLSRIINKYSEHESVTVLARKFSSEGLKNLSWNYDYLNPDNRTLNKLIEVSDIIHYHNLPSYNGVTYNKPAVLQFHSQPEHHSGGYLPNKTYREFNGKKLVVAQYQPRFYTDAVVVPNMLDIWDSMYEGSTMNNGRLTIFFGYASEATGWAYKGVKEVTEILEQFKKTCNVYIVTNTPYEQMMEIKRKADIVVGDCITGSYHLGDLEGAAVGAIVFNNCDDLTKGFMRRVSGVESTPFQQTKIGNLGHAIQHYIDNTDMRENRKKKNRVWMEEHWNPQKLVEHFIKQYERVLHARY